MKPTAAPPIFPFPDHKPMNGRGDHNRKPGEQTLMRGWWPSSIAGYDIAGRRIAKGNG